MAHLIEHTSPTAYAKVLELQRGTHAAVAAGELPDTLILTEHNPVITLGKYADPAGILASEEVLNVAGIEVHRVERGGQATYHGPGQLVGYPIWNISKSKMGVKRFVSMLEQVMIETARGFGVEAARREGLPGVYVGEGKLGAVGVAIRSGVALHGFAFNVQPDLAHYRFIVPCARGDIPPLSLASILGEPLDMEAVRNCLKERFERVFSVDLVRGGLSAGLVAGQNTG